MGVDAGEAGVVTPHPFGVELYGGDGIALRLDGLDDAVLGTGAHIEAGGDVLHGLVIRLVFQETIEGSMGSIVFPRLDLDRKYGHFIRTIHQIVHLALLDIVIIEQIVSVSLQFLRMMYDFPT